jgi:aminopeptidase N
MLGRRGGEEAAEALMSAYLHESDPRVLRRIAEALGSFRTPKVAEFLATRLESPQDTWHLTGALLASLGRTRNPIARDRIPSFLKPLSWGDVVAAGGLDGLACTEDPAVFEVLVEYTRADCRPRVRAAAARAIGKLAEQVELVRTRAVERLCEMLVEPGYRSQLGAISGLGRIRDDRALGSLAQVHRTAPDGRTRRMAYEAMHAIREGRKPETALVTLRKRVDDLEEQNQKLRRRLEKLEPVSG